MEIKVKVKKFIKSILEEVSEGVDESNNERVSFNFMQSSSEGIDFDLAVVLKKEGKAKAGLEIPVVGGIGIKGNLSQEVINRIKFRVHPYIKNWNKKK